MTTLYQHKGVATMAANYFNFIKSSSSRKVEMPLADSGRESLRVRQNVKSDSLTGWDVQAGSPFIQPSYLILQLAAEYVAEKLHFIST